MGAGRSGSTILGVTLGNCPGVLYAGELDAWLVRTGEPLVSDERHTRFWRALRERVPAEAALLFGRESERAIERSLSLFRLHKWPARRRLRARYRRVAEGLYRAVAATAEATHVVDSSHYPMRARELQAIAGIDLHLVYLARDPQRVVGSFGRRDVAQYNKSTLTTNVYLWLTNLLAIAVFLRQPRERRVFVRYEDFVADPAGVLTALRERLRIPAPPPDLGALQTGVAFVGNRLIRSPVIALAREDPGRLAARRSLLTSFLQAPWSAILARLRPRAVAVSPRRAVCDP
jgi:hypothetical protein